MHADNTEARKAYQVKLLISHHAPVNCTNCTSAISTLGGDILCGPTPIWSWPWWTAANFSQCTGWKADCAFSPSRLYFYIYIISTRWMSERVLFHFDECYQMFLFKVLYKRCFLIHREGGRNMAQHGRCASFERPPAPDWRHESNVWPTSVKNGWMPNGPPCGDGLHRLGMMSFLSDGTVELFSQDFILNYPRWLSTQCTLPVTET